MIKTSYISLLNKTTGIRVLVTRHKPKSLKNEDYEVWAQELSPSKKILEEYKAGNLSWEEFEEKFKQEILVSQPAQNKLAKLKELAKTSEVTLFCCEKKINLS